MKILIKIFALTAIILSNVYCTSDTKSYKIGNCNLHIAYEDITTIKVDAIVNAANKDLMKNPGGVAGFIWQAAGADQLNNYIDKNIKRPLKIGSAVETPAFKLSNHGVKYIIHTPGPNCSAGDDIELLYNSYKNSLILAGKLNCKTIAFPAISIGIFCCDIATCAELAIQAIKENIASTNLSAIYLVISKNPNDKNAQLYRNALISAANKFELI